MKGNKGIVRFSGSGTDIGDLYSDLVEAFPGVFREGLADPLEQLTEIAGRVEKLKADKKLTLGDVVSEGELRRRYAEPAVERFEDYFSGKPISGKPKNPIDIDDVSSEAADEIYGFADSVTGIGQLAHLINNVHLHRFKDLDTLTEKAFGNVPELWNVWNEKFAVPFYKSKGAYARNVTDKANELFETVVKDTKGPDGKKIKGIKSGSRESAAVMQYGEGQRQVRDNRGRLVYEEDTIKMKDGKPAKRFGKFGPVVREKGKPVLEKYTLDDLKREFPERWEKIVEAERYARKVYDGYFDRLNASLREQYPDVEKEVERILKAGGKEKIVIGDVVRGKNGAVGTVTDIAPEGWYEVTFNNKSSGKNTVAQMNRADMMSNRTYQKIEDATRNKRIYRRKDYYHHAQELEKSGFVSVASDIINPGTAIDPTLIGVSEFTKPYGRFTGFLERRRGGEYAEDAVGNLMRYIPQAEYKIEIEPHIRTLRTMSRELKDATRDPKSINGFIEAIDDLANDLAGKTPSLDRVAYNVIGDEDGRTVLNKLLKFSMIPQANAVLGNLGSALSQFYGIRNVVGYANGNRANVLRGMGDAIASLKKGSAEAEFFKKSHFLAERWMGRELRKFDESIFSKPGKLASLMMEFGDRAVAKTAFSAFYRDAVAEGLDDAAAVLRADRLTRMSVAGRGIGEMPIHMRSKLMRSFFPFQVEVLKDLNTFAEKSGKGKAFDVFAIFATTALLNLLRKQLTGADGIGTDPIGTAGESLYEDYKSGDVSVPDALRRAGVRTAGNFISNLPFGNYLADVGKETLGLSDNDTRLLFEGEDPSRFSTGNMGLLSLGAPIGDFMMGRDPDLLKPVLAFAPRFGGRQAEKTIRGLQDMAVLPDVKIQNIWNGSGEPVVSRRDFPSSYSAGGDLRFAPEPTAGNTIRAALFGSFSTAEGRDYLAGDAKPLSAGQTSKVEEAYRNAYMSSVVPPAAAVDAFRNKSSADTDGSGGATKKEIAAYVLDVAEKYGLDENQREVLYRLLTETKKKEEGEDE
jgi:hypothetical protein